MCNSRWCERHGGLCLFLRRHLLSILNLVSVVVGIAMGFGLRTRAEPWTRRELMYVSFIGDIYLRILTCLVLPLITSSLISSLGSLDPRLSGKIALRAILYYLTTLPCAVSIGILLVTTIHPGRVTEPRHIVQLQSAEVPGTSVDTLLDLLRNLFTDNLVASCFEQYMTVLEPPNSKDKGSDSNYVLYTVRNFTSNMTGHRNVSVYDYRISHRYTRGNNIVGLIVFCIFLGVSIRRLKKKGRGVLVFFTSLYEVIMDIIQIVIWLSPIGVMFLICGQILRIVDFQEMFGHIWLYAATVLLGLVIHGFLVIPLIYFVVTRANPYRFIWNQMEALTTAFATCSSVVTMPVSIRCLEDQNAVHPKVARFVLPIGIVNLEGCALYEAVSVIFIAQLNGVDLYPTKIILLSVTSIAASMGSAGVPEAGLVIMILILNAAGLPAENISFIAVVDFILNRLRVLVNVLGDCVGAGIVNYLSKPDLRRFDSLSSTDTECCSRKSSSLDERMRSEKEKRASVDSGVDIHVV